MNCAICGCLSNHTTLMHMEADRLMCRNCDQVEVHDDDGLCAECLSELASSYVPDEGGNG
jgi:hypothetical protein